MNNISTLFHMIELPYDQLDEYENKMPELVWVEPPKDGSPDLRKETTSVAPQAQLAPQTSIEPKKDDKKKMQSILKVVFRLNDSKPLKERVRDFD